MSGKRNPGSRSGSPSGFAAVLLLIPLLSVALLVAGCGVGDETTTTSLVPGPVTTASPVTSSSSDTTAATVAPTTITSGIVITIPSTSSTEATTTTTTQALSSAETRLANGHVKAMGFIDKVYIKGGKRYLTIDYAEMLTGQAAIDAAVAAGFIEPGDDLPNDYWIRNENPQKRTFEVSNAVAITTSTRWVPGDDMGAPCNWTDFKSFWGPTGALGDSERHLHSVPWWIERDGPLVVRIDEQYLP